MEWLTGNKEKELEILRNQHEELINKHENTQTLASKIEEIRCDHKNSLTTIGEAIDNSIGSLGYMICLRTR